MNNQKFSKLKSFLSWFRRHLNVVIILGVFVAFTGILMSRGENFLQAVQGSYTLVSWFQSYDTGYQYSSDPLSIPALIVILLILIGIVIFLWIKYGLKK